MNANGSPEVLSAVTPEQPLDMETQQNILDALPIGILMVNVSGQCRYANSAFFSILGIENGIPPNQFDLENLSVLKSPEFDSIFARILSGENVHCEGMSLHGPNGSRLKRINLCGIPTFDDDNEVTGGSLLVNDVSETWQLEEQLHQAQKMDAVGRLACGVAHDFNNLLTAIIGYAEIASITLEPESPLRERFAKILTVADHATALTRQLLVFSRRTPYNPVAIDLEKHLTKFHSMLSRLIGTKIELKVRVTADTPPILADPTLLEQVIVNLVVNARDAMPDGGKLLIGATEKLVSSQPGSSGLEKQKVTLMVCDEGCGISDEMLPHIFEPFFTTKSKSEGTGLGLSTVYGIVKKMGGEIYVESEVNLGTTFYVDLLAATGCEPEAETDDDQDLVFGSGSILLVEDNPKAVEVIRSFLQQIGYEVHEANDGSVAISQLTNGDVQPDLILSDVFMPVTDGIELYKSVRESYPNIPVVLMSGSMEEVHSLLSPEVEKPLVLPKPFRLKELSIAIANHLAEKLN